MKLYCEFVVQEVLPALRALAANELMSKTSLTQTQVSQVLGITQPAVSQYMKESRGNKVRALRSNRKIMKSIESLCGNIVKNNLKADEIQTKFLELGHRVVDEKIIGQDEKIYSHRIPCNICFK